MAGKSPKRRLAAKTPKPKAPAKPKSGAKSATQAKTKLEAVIAALSAPKGATLAQLMTLTGWQMHSVRGAMSGALKRQRRLKIVSSKPGKERIYRIKGGR